MKLWMRGLQETVYAKPRNRADRVGTRFTQRIKEGRRVVEYSGEVTAYDKPHHFAVRVGNEKFVLDLDYRFSELGDRTRLDYSASGPPAQGFARPTAALFSYLTRRIAAKQLRRLKKAAESEAAAQ
jgi:hypothetical protein